MAQAQTIQPHRVGADGVAATGTHSAAVSLTVTAMATHATGVSEPSGSRESLDSVGPRGVRSSDTAGSPKPSSLSDMADSDPAISIAPSIEDEIFIESALDVPSPVVASGGADNGGASREPIFVRIGTRATAQRCVGALRWCRGSCAPLRPRTAASPERLKSILAGLAHINLDPHRSRANITEPWKRQAPHDSRLIEYLASVPQNAEDDDEEDEEHLTMCMDRPDSFATLSVEIEGWLTKQIPAGVRGRAG